MKLLYFAWVRLEMGVSGETVEPPLGVLNVQTLVEWLKERDAVSNKVFSNLTTVRVAVNQDYVSFDHPVKIGDEIAFFPPVTGG
jgi:molybdopterin synthase sulfur carrier subunit